ncbi:MAG: inositol monophosphatase [Candidatus Eisenbacteria bacterium]|nr:inositol monophosphatase [Candidatus Eisenbacteria bacterium]
MRRETRVAVEAAKKAGARQRECFERPMDVETKSGRELVTEIDRDSERTILAAIEEAFPGDPVIAEESAPGGARESGQAGRVWIVDPLDGTNNYAHGYPFFSIAIAVEEEGRPTAAVVYDPLRDELFSAERGGGAFKNGDRIVVSKTRTLSESLVTTGFPYGRTDESENNLANLSRFILTARGVRRGGSAELDLVYVACGRLDGFWELGLKTWDVAAGGLVVGEAGGRVTNFGGDGWDHRRGDIVASNGLIHDEMMEIIE